MGFAWFRIVKISQVRFVPRQVYTVNLVTPIQAAEPKKVEVAPEPPAPKPEPVVEEEEEMPPPPEKPKPKPKPKQEKPKIIEKKTVPSTDTERTVEPTTDELVTTGDIMLDGQDFPFAYYLATMKRRIAAFWQVPGTQADPKYCRVYFRVGRDGSIQSPSVETPSGNFLFDQAALRAVVQASPLPPLPDGFGDDFLGVHFSFAYEQD